MTRAAPQRVQSPAEVFVPVRESLVLSWSIARSAAGACGLVAEGCGPAVQLEVVITGPGAGAAQIEARVVDGERRVPLESSPRCGTWIQDSMRGVWHMDIDGLLKLTIRTGEGRVEALYARTALLAKAGLAGGRYEFDGARLLAGG